MTSSPPSDWASTVSLAQAGDPGSVTTVHRAWEPIVDGFLRAKFPGLSEADQDEAKRRTWSRIFVGPPPELQLYDPGRESFHGSWVCQRARWSGLDVLRRLRAGRVEGLDEAAPDPDSNLGFRRLELREVLRLALIETQAILEPLAMLVFKLHFLESNTLEAIGERLGMSKSDVGRVVDRGREVFTEAYARHVEPADPGTRNVVALRRGGRRS